MSPFLGEIRMFAGNYLPEQEESGMWAFCNGAQLKISEYPALYSVLGTTYGGDGVSTFNLPNLSNSVSTPIHVGQGTNLSPIRLAQAGGAMYVTLTGANLPAHTHSLNTMNVTGTASDPSGQYVANTATRTVYFPSTGGTMEVMGQGAISTSYGNSSVTASVVQPSMAINFIIALQGIFPDPS